MQDNYRTSYSYEGRNVVNYRVVYCNECERDCMWDNYKCGVCVNFDLCSDCFMNRRDTHDSSHHFWQQITTYRRHPPLSNEGGGVGGGVVVGGVDTVGVGVVEADGGDGVGAVDGPQGGGGEENGDGKMDGDGDAPAVGDGVGVDVVGVGGVVVVGVGGVVVVDGDGDGAGGVDGGGDAVGVGGVVVLDGDNDTGRLIEILKNTFTRMNIIIPNNFDNLYMDYNGDARRLKDVLINPNLVV
eukprot:GHVR01088787.1.p1 GENE.GHVR01088787.1~~GHVR01088787.1.p1  ORF type:complete len:241 (+),score=106.42 GHVR01088787.1:41-763(+)